MSNLLITSVPFHADRLLVVERDGEPFVPMKPIAEAMGLAWQAQHAKLKANPARWGITEIVIPSAGGEQAMSCLPLPRVFGWLMTISPNKVKPELREKVIAYQTECDRVLWQHWSGRHRKAETQAEKYWFGRRSHWKAVRTLVFEGATYSQAGQWADANGFPRDIVYRVLNGRSPAWRGRTHQVAVALGIKPNVNQPTK